MMCNWLCRAVCLACLLCENLGTVRASDVPLTGSQLTSEALDALLRAEWGEQTDLVPASDELFLRRLTLDIAGRQPTPEEFQAFLAETAMDKRAQAIDRLLNQPEFGQTWADYWSDTIAFRTPQPELTFLNYTTFKHWLSGELNQDVPWDKIVSQMLMASGKVKENPAGTFVGFHQGEPTRLASETARVFLSLQIGCAQCHDHPFDDWKREQFHELAAYFARVQVKLPWNDSDQIEIKDKGKGEYVMPNVADPRKKGETMTPVFLTGTWSEPGESDLVRRQQLANLVANRDNPWFARSFVNRIWARLMGRGFIEPVDDFGPTQAVTLRAVHEALAADFRERDMHIKGLFRLILNSAAYQRSVKANETELPSSLQVRIAKLRGDEVFQSLVTAVGLPNITPPALPATAAMRFPPPPKSTRDLVAETFGFDPSLRNQDVNRTMSQAMWMMNNEQLQAQINAQPASGTRLAQLVARQQDNAAAVRELFVMTLGRQATSDDVAIGVEHVQSTPTREEGFEDLLWGLINSAEFSSRR